MLHILTVHWNDDKWIDIQLDYLRKHIRQPYKVYAFLNNISVEHRKKFFYSSIEPIKEHAIKLISWRTSRLSMRKVMTTC